MKPARLASRVRSCWFSSSKARIPTLNWSSCSFGADSSNSSLASKSLMYCCLRCLWSVQSSQPAKVAERASRAGRRGKAYLNSRWAIRFWILRWSLSRLVSDSQGGGSVGPSEICRAESPAPADLDSFDFLLLDGKSVSDPSCSSLHSTISQLPFAPQLVPRSAQAHPPARQTVPATPDLPDRPR